MTPDEFRAAGHEMVEWLADYMESVGSLPIIPDVKPGDVVAALPEAAPEHSESFAAIVADLDDIIKPALTHWQSPGWFAYFPANTSGPGILGDLVASGLGQQGMLWATSPAATELEMVVVDWLVDLLGLPAGWKTSGRGGGVIQMSASDSTHTALVVARHRRRDEAAAGDMVAYTSAQAHSSIQKGANIAGYGHVRLVDVGEDYAMDVAALETAIAADLAAGLTPAFVCSAVGTTGTTAVDPVRRTGEVARRHGLWHHVDAAYAGTAMICEEFRHLQDGLELVDSYTFNPHKWMFTNFDCNVFYVADREPLIDAMSITPPYLRNQATDSGEVIDYRDWHVPLGRRFRALKLWFVLRSYGAAGIRGHIREHVRLARLLEERLVADARFEMVAPTPFALVSFRHVAGSEATMSLADAVNASGHSYVTPSQIDGEAFIRVSVGQTYTTQEHVDRLWRLIDQSAVS
jgi:aromatic-L-amino-acid decarboxylase